MYSCHGDKSRYTRANPTRTHAEGETVQGPHTGGRRPDVGWEPPIEEHLYPRPAVASRSLLQEVSLSSTGTRHYVARKTATITGCKSSLTAEISGDFWVFTRLKSHFSCGDKCCETWQKLFFLLEKCVNVTQQKTCVWQKRFSM